MFAPHSSVGTPECVSVPRRLTREQVVDRILTINPTADADFLRPFTDDELRIYMLRLDASQEPRGRRAVWVRRDGRPGISARSRRV